MDNARIRHLYSKFRSRESNPEGFDSKLEHWINAINEYSVNNHVYFFNLLSLQQHFKLGELIPDLSTLHTVVTVMKQKNQISILDEYLKNNSQGWISWGVSGFSKLFFTKQTDEITVDPNILPETNLINIKSLENGSTFLISLISDSGLINKAIPIKNLEKLAAKEGIISEQLDMLIHHLQLSKKVTQDKSLNLIKFGEPLSDLEIGKARLEKARRLLEDQMLKVEEEIEECVEEAKIHLSQGNKTKARTLLRRKRRLEDIWNKKEIQLGNIESLMGSLSDVNSNKVIYDAYKRCAETLKNVQINDAKLNDLMCDMDEIADVNTTIETELGRPFTSFHDDDDLEKELMELCEETNKDKKLKNDFEDLEDRLKKLRGKEKIDVKSSSDISTKTLDKEIA